MPYLQVDVDALDLFDQVAMMAHLEPGVVYRGFLKLWQHCWRAKVDRVDPAQLRGFFPVQEPAQLVKAGESAGFLRMSEGNVVVRGAEKRLRVFQAQSEAGKKQSRNLKQAPKTETEPPSPPRLDPELSAGSTSGLRPALSPNHPNTQSPNHQEKLAGEERPPAQEQPKDERVKPLTVTLEASFREVVGGKYKHGGAKDTQALKRLLAVATPEEIDARWRKGLGATGWLRVSTFAQLDSKWNDLSAQRVVPVQRDWAKGRVGAEEIDKSKLSGGVRHDF